MSPGVLAPGLIEGSGRPRGDHKLAEPCTSSTPLSSRMLVALLAFVVGFAVCVAVQRTRWVIFPNSGGPTALLAWLGGPDELALRIMRGPIDDGPTYSTREPMAQRIVVTCDQCQTEATNRDPHAHAGTRTIPDGWSELVLSRARRLPLPPGLMPQMPPYDESEQKAWLASLTDEDREEIERVKSQQQMHAHSHVNVETRASLLCPECSSALTLLCGDRTVKLEREPGPYSIIGSGPYGLTR